MAIAGCGSGDLKSGFTHRTHYNIVPGYAATSEAHKFAELVQDYVVQHDLYALEKINLG